MFTFFSWGSRGRYWFGIRPDGFPKPTVLFFFFFFYTIPDFYAGPDLFDIFRFVLRMIKFHILYFYDAIDDSYDVGELRGCFYRPV